MANPSQSVAFALTDGSFVTLIIFSESDVEASLQLIDAAEAADNGEAPLQLMEGFSYEYQIEGNYRLQEVPKIVTPSRANISSGRITPSVYVGSLVLDVLDKDTSLNKGSITIEVRSIKTSYRQDYRFMLEDITEKCTDLLMQYTSPVSQHFTVDFNRDPQTLYQRFAFVKSLIESSDFKEAVHRIVSSPVTSWAEKEEERDIRRARRINNATMRQFITSSSRLELPPNHPLHGRLASIPAKLRIRNKHETVDTPENRFIKHALTSFTQFCTEIRIQFSEDSRAYQEVVHLEEVLENFLSHSVFKDVSPLISLNLNSPVLQRKEGYREVLRAWLMFDMAAKLIWKGGDDVYDAGKRDVATLYEYWLFFTLLDIFKELFKVEPSTLEKLIKPTADGLGLQLKAGKFIPFQGIFEAGGRKLRVQFSYNRTFRGDQPYPSGGSWTKAMRPDYTLSIWPEGIKRNDAEEQELITHVHFDAKYKVSHLTEIVGEDNLNLSEEKEEQKKGNYKREDLLKMHAYRDAIRRTGGAYILYPGSQLFNKSGFHEIIPGLGAFPVSPSRDKNGISDLKAFISEIINQILNRASQKEQLSYRTYNIHKDGPSDILQESIPEKYGNERTPPPNDIHVLVGYFKDTKHLNWINEQQLYNARIDSDRGSLHLGPSEAGARYLLLHTKAQLTTGEMWRIKGKGPRVFSKKAMMKRNYPNPSQPFYLVYEIEKVRALEFDNMKWDIRLLEKHSKGRGSALPFAVSLTELMKAKV
ncbi:DUF2357 domain-containing protein [Pontibacter sp. HSC-36F09]|uniref:DUF2357 domain-containing protein n=1 Tax=Pontibacter sp. HSC-36F09 TaxID=2910966 RepID=UPI00209F5C5E|nr:DUF2357 domain-containing protein [Pontibacter sp. HSC-36F09]MCP2045130.1 putative component of viral defense system (DUF524 family) [Pontibacter sp. HSC-36F09]